MSDRFDKGVIRREEGDFYTFTTPGAPAADRLPPAPEPAPKPSR